MNDVRTTIKRLWDVFVIFIAKLVLASLLVGIDVGLKQLARIALGPETPHLKVVELVLDVCFVGAFVVIAAAGVIIVVAEVMRSTWEYVGRRRP